jgi:thiamine biosynthesis lipoprotein
VEGWTGTEPDEENATKVVGSPGTIMYEEIWGFKVVSVMNSFPNRVPMAMSPVWDSAISTRSSENPTRSNRSALFRWTRRLLLGPTGDGQPSLGSGFRRTATWRGEIRYLWSMRRIWSSSLLLALAALALLVIGGERTRAQGEDSEPAARESADYQVSRLEIMGTQIQAVLPEGETAGAHAEAVFDVFREVDARMSEWKPSSPLSAVNAAAGEAPVSVPEDLRNVIREGLEIGELTDGAFDITWAALWGVWDFKAAEPRVPDVREVTVRAALVDYRNVELDDVAGTVRLTQPGMKIGLGGIAKGHALGKAARVLRDSGLTSFMLLAGGQVLVSGKKGDRLWRVGIRDPRGGPEDFFAQLEVTNVSVSTSGDYENFFVVDRTRYHHILDPRTGMPARGLRSATVLSPDATLADALSTAVMVMGKERGLALVESLAGVEAVLVDDEGEVYISEGLEDRVAVKHPPARD